MAEYKKVWEKRIQDVLVHKAKTIENEDLWKIVSLILYEKANDTLIAEIYDFFEDKDQFARFINLLDGRTFRSPYKKDLQEAILTGVFYYEKEIQGKTWKEIKDSLDFDVSSVKYGIRIRNLNNWLKQKMYEILSKGE